MSGTFALKEISQANFTEFLRQQAAIPIFSPPRCASCRKIAPSLEALARQRAVRVALGMRGVSSNTPDSPQVQVLSAPAAIVSVDGREVRRLQRFASGAETAKALEAHL